MVDGCVRGAMMVAWRVDSVPRIAGFAVFF